MDLAIFWIQKWERPERTMCHFNFDEKHTQEGAKKGKREQDGCQDCRLIGISNEIAKALVFVK